MTEATDNVQPSPSRSSNHLLWLGPLVVFTGAVSYFLFFTRFPDLRDFPWVNLPWVLIGLAMSVMGLLRAYRPDSGPRSRILGSLGLMASLTLGGLFLFYVFVFSYMVPAPTAQTLALTDAPDFELSDHQGKPVRLSQFRGRRVLLTFYRGFW